MARPDHEILDRFHKVRSKGVGNKGQQMWEAYCPAHETHHHSLSIWKHPDGGWHVHCHAGCFQEEILGEVGLRVADLCPESDTPIGRYDNPKTIERSRFILAIADADRERGKRLTQKDKQVEREAWLYLKKGGNL